MSTVQLERARVESERCGDRPRALRVAPGRRRALTLGRRWPVGPCRRCDGAQLDDGDEAAGDGRRVARAPLPRPRRVHRGRRSRAISWRCSSTAMACADAADAASGTRAEPVGGRCSSWSATAGTEYAAPDFHAGRASSRSRAIRRSAPRSSSASATASTRPAPDGGGARAGVAPPSGTARSCSARWSSRSPAGAGRDGATSCSRRSRARGGCRSRATPTVRVRVRGDSRARRRSRRSHPTWARSEGLAASA